MRRYVDKTVLLIGGALLLLLIGLQARRLHHTLALMEQARADARELAQRADGNDLPDMARNPALYSGRVFKAWEDLPFARTLDPWDFYPNQPLP